MSMVRQAFGQFFFGVDSGYALGYDAWNVKLSLTRSAVFPSKLESALNFNASFCIENNFRRKLGAAVRREVRSRLIKICGLTCAGRARTAPEKSVRACTGSTFTPSQCEAFAECPSVPTL
ncbi:hypothetical protein EVAR_78408_1 [Eumeta japonica]|uniref:Uncharacterized protein n=1 Tax=Eumeta variegata TaxID=151549 RepID=A0A4C1T736_EUMVA|nr:hypothetical protein EVAR_78408_1 [Eumeta japonica]